MEYGLQMYSVRDLTKTDMRSALQQVAAMGYSFVEFAGFMGNSAEDVKSWLDEFGLRVSSTHTPLVELEDDKLEETIAYHKAIGCTDIIIPYAKQETKEQIDALVERVNVLIPRLQAEGISLHYHNHDCDFVPTAEGMIPEMELLNRTNILLEVDTYWTFVAKKDPVAFITEHKDRIHMIHLKDGMGNREGKSLGQGVAPVAAVRKAAIELGFPMVVESEGLDPTGLEEVKRCIDFLREEDAK
ncbi:xylose isomerase domain protein TIM barrel [Clostridium sp. CAG:1013]|nr:xylose isomerase domain protein TIM barrel [Clostridium sp. CAG:1013]